MLDRIRGKNYRGVKVVKMIELLDSQLEAIKENIRHQQELGNADIVRYLSGRYDGIILCKQLLIQLFDDQSE